ncbi:transposase [uncultured Desulfosarcina sp.]|uniref:transposase n=1 Tax=uncultured Desulfosarcina sp. TaxID=218289 RepID=UPI0037491BE0
MEWCGQLGKTDNCLVGVYSTLCHGQHATPIGLRLYLPQSWVDDEQHCRESGVPNANFIASRTWP